jgi:hypothetical protein
MTRVIKIAQARKRSGTLQEQRKTSSIFPVQTAKGINEAIPDEMRVHNFPPGLIKISSENGTLEPTGHFKNSLFYG